MSSVFSRMPLPLHQCSAVQRYIDLGQRFRSIGKLAAAATCYRLALSLQPDAAELYNNLGSILRAQGQTALAVQYLEQALRLQPAFPEALGNLGNAWRDLGQLDVALACFQEALRYKPQAAELHSNLGVALYRQGRYTEAIASYREAIRLNPQHAEAHCNLALVAQEQGDLETALKHCQQALYLRPDLPEASYNLGIVWQALGDLDAARAAYCRALRLRPGYAAVYTNLGTVLQQQGDLTGAMAAYQQVLSLRPDDVATQWNMALLQLTLGQLATGWVQYKWRWHTGKQPQRGFPYALWDGATLRSRNILVYAEQGVGDELLFATCLPDLLAHAGQVVLECDPRLAPLFARSLPNARVCGVSRQERHWLAHCPPLDVQSPGGSLPRYLRPTLGHFPLRRGYVVPEPARVELWRTRLAALGPGLKVGMAWRSGLQTVRRNRRYPDLGHWAPLWRLAGIHWVNLQYDTSAADISRVEQQGGMRLHQWPDLDLRDDFEAMAALMTALDLVIAPATAVVQLAGSVGAPVWRLSGYDRDEMWLGTEVVPWFPTMRLYRQPQPGDWASVFTRLAADLECLATEFPGA